MKTLAIHQPAYNPWLGYIHRIALADTFVFLDTVQFEKNSFTNRNRVRIGKTNTTWLTVPVRQKGHISATLLELKIADQSWSRKHLRTLEQNYGSAPYFSDVYPAWKSLLTAQHTYLADLCWDMLQWICGTLNIGTELIRASRLNISGEKSELVLNLAAGLNADRYISGPLGRDYLEQDQFAVRGIDLFFHEYIHPRYPQSGDDFIPNLGVFDLLCEVHPDERMKIIHSDNSTVSQ